MPDDRVVILGLVSTKRPQLEDPAELKHRVAEAAKVFPLAQLGLGPQCGFASQIEGNLVTPDDQRKKLALVARTARDIWP